MNIFGFGNGRRSSIVRFAAGGGNFGSDDVERLRGTRRQFTMRSFCRLAQDGGAFGDCALGGACTRIIRTRHARVEVDLLVARRDTIADQSASFLQR